MSKKKKRSKNNVKTQSGLSAFLRQPAVQIGMLVIVALIVYLIAAAGSSGTSAGTTSLARDVSTDQAYQMYQQSDVLFVDVREQFEWDEYHAPNATLIPLGELASRVNEVSKDKKIVVVCRSGNRSQEGRDILLAAGFDATSMTGGLKEWYAKGYPVVGAPAQ